MPRYGQCNRQALQLFELLACNVKTFLLGDQKGAILFCEREWPPLPRAAPAALPARLSGQKVVYGCMQGTGVIFRDTVTVSGCLLLRPLRLPAAWRHPVVRPDSDRQLLAHPPVSAEPAGAVSGCRYGPMRENPACSDRSGRAAPVAP